MSNIPAAPDAPRTFAGDPNPPAKAPDAPAVSAPAAPTTSAGTGALPPETQPGQQNQPASTDRSYSVVERPDGSRDVFMSDKNGDTKLGTANIDDADKVLHASSRYDEKSKTWDNVPEETAKSLISGRLGFPERIAQAWNGGEAGVVRSMLGAKIMSGEMTGEAAREQGEPLLLKARLDQDPTLAWQGGFGKTVAQWAKHPLNAVEQGAVDAVGMAPMVKDIFLHGTVPGGAAGAATGAGAALLTGPAAPADILPMMSAGLEIGAKLGTFGRAFNLFGGQFAMQMADKGYDDPTIKKYAPMVGVVNAALTAVQFDLMTPSMQQKALQGIAGSEAVKSAMASALFKFAGRTAGFTATIDAQTLVNDYTNNLAATAAKRPDLLVPGKDMIAHLGEATLKAMIPGAGMAAVTGGLEEAGAPKTPSQERQEQPAPGLAPGEQPASSDAPTGASAGEPRQNPSGSSEEGSSLPPGQEAKGASSESSVADKAEFDKVLKYRQMEGEKTPADTVTRMKGEADGMREVLAAKPDHPNAKFIQDSLARHEGDIATLEKGAPKPREFFGDSTPPEIKPLGTDAKTSEDIRQQLTGNRDEQIARVNQLTRQFRKAVPDLEQRQGAAWYLDAGGDRNALEAMLEEAKQARANEGMDGLNPDTGELIENADSTLGKHVEEIEAALNLDPKTQKWADTAGRYYSEAAEVGQEHGTLTTARENYVNRVYQPEKTEDFVKSGMESGVRPATGHSLARTYDTMADAARAGKSFATTDLADLMSIHNEEMARANSARATFDAMEQAGLGAWKRDVPEGWAQVGSLEKRVPLKGQDGQALIGEDGNQVVSRSVFAAPKGIAKGLEAISDPNFVKKIDALRGIARYQGLVKTVDLSFSLFHHLSMMAQLFYSAPAEAIGDVVNKVRGVEPDTFESAGVSAIFRPGKMDELLSTPDFGEREQEFAKYGGVTAITADNQDILRNLTRDEGDTFSKVVNAPGVKQVLEATDKSADFLFGKVQRLWKVDTYSKLAANWAADHPDATNTETTAAMRGFARHVNDRFGGQNWEAMGMTKSNLALLRIGLLAPDWTISNMHILKAAIGEGGTGGSAARVHVLSSLIVGMAATEGLNHLLTGHYTDENKPGHKLEVEISPNVYVSLLRGGVQDIMKLGSMVAESGLAGVSRFAQGKLSPFARTGVGLLTNTQYTGQPIVPKNYKSGSFEKNLPKPVAATYDVLKYALNSATPIPLGLSNLAAYAQSSEPTARGALAVGTGVGRFSQGKKEK